MEFVGLLSCAGGTGGAGRGGKEGGGILRSLTFAGTSELCGASPAAAGLVPALAPASTLPVASAASRSYCASSVGSIARVFASAASRVENVARSSSCSFCCAASCTSHARHLHIGHTSRLHRGTSRTNSARRQLFTRSTNQTALARPPSATAGTAGLGQRRAVGADPRLEQPARAGRLLVRVFQRRTLPTESAAGCDAHGRNGAASRAGPCTPAGPVHAVRIRKG